MGITHSICQLSGLGIVSYIDRIVRIVLVAPDRDTYQPIALPIYGDYNDYGNIDKPGLLDGDRAIVNGVLAMHARGELTWSDTAEITDEMTEANLVAIIEEIRQGMIYEAVRRSEEPSRMMRASGVPIHLVYILDSFYDAAISMQKSTLSEEERERLDEQLDAPFEQLTAALGMPALASRLVFDSRGVREELVDFALFRSWFDARRTWAPASPIGHQLGRSDLRARAKIARGALEEWPQLVRCLDRYDRHLLEGAAAT